MRQKEYNNLLSASSEQQPPNTRVVLASRRFVVDVDVDASEALTHNVG